MKREMFSLFAFSVTLLYLHQKQLVSLDIQTDSSDIGDQYTICTYFVTIGKSASHDKENSEMLEVWKESWMAQGWDVKVLNERNAKLHPRYGQLKTAITKLPTAFAEAFSSACYLRWAAAVASGCNVSTLSNHFVANLM